MPCCLCVLLWAPRETQDFAYIQGLRHVTKNGRQNPSYCLCVMWNAENVYFIGLRINIHFHDVVYAYLFYLNSLRIVRRQGGAPFVRNTRIFGTLCNTLTDSHIDCSMTHYDFYGYAERAFLPSREGFSVRRNTLFRRVIRHVWWDRTAFSVMYCMRNRVANVYIWCFYTYSSGVPFPFYKNQLSIFFTAGIVFLCNGL